MHAGMGLGVDLGFVLWKATFVAILTGWVGMAVGLFTSSVWKSSEAAVGTLPLLLIPQITFSGILVSISDMDELAKAVTWGTFQRYSFDALLKCGEKMSYIYRGKWDVQGIVAPLYNLGLKPRPATDMGISWESLVGIHLGIILFVLSATMLVVRAGRGGRALLADGFGTEWNGERARRQAAETRKLILDAAQAAFADGFAGTRMRKWPPVQRCPRHCSTTISAASARCTMRCEHGCSVPTLGALLGDFPWIPLRWSPGCVVSSVSFAVR